jgi:sucrose-6-phosphate hydrolase SacC (GH32 family)
MFGMPPANLVQEPTRPQFHFTAQSGWLNDPNGLVFYKSEYHMFFQHNPTGVQWGNMTWGHAVSRDLVHWRQIENALSPDALGTMFSGSAVVDRANTSGFGQGAMVLFYTAAGGTNDASKGKPFSQCMAWSADGRTFTKFDQNPVIGHVEAENRDPKVVWHEPTKRWVMALYLKDDKYALFGSSDLKSWSKLSDVVMSGTGECPDFFELPLLGDKKTKFWVFSGANGNYRLGSFDGTNFKPVTSVLKSNYGPNSYAAQTFFNEPKGRRVQIAWMNGSEFKGASWNQQMSVPRQLTIRLTPLGARLFTEPVAELKSLRWKKVKAVGSLEAAHFEFEVPGGLAEIDADLVPPRSGVVMIEIGDQSVVYSTNDKTLELGSAKALCELDKGHLRLRIFVDRGSIEVFAQDGLVSIPMFVVNPVSDLRVTVKTTGVWKAPRLNVYELKSALGASSE